MSGAAIVQTAMKYIGYPYSATGASPSTGFSCIGFVSFVYRQNGINLPGDLSDALAYAPQVPFSSLQPGDVLYFQNTVWPGISHAAIYIGGGKFIHSEYFGVGVRISSFNNDARDGNYWTQKYMTANRPWSGPAVTTVVGSPGSAAAPVTPPAAPSVSAVKTVANGPTALVTVPSLNVRAGPSMSAGVQQVITSGTSVVVVGTKKGWYKVQLPDGTIGWVVAIGLNLGSSQSGQSSAAASPSTPSTAGSPGTATTTTVGNPTAPTQVQAVKTAKSPHGRTATVQTDVLRVHSAPGTGAPVVTTLSRGQRLVVIGKSNGWVKVRLPDGSTGWISGQYASVHGRSQKATSTSSAPAQNAAVVTTSGPTQTAQAALNVRSSPSFTAAVVTVLAPGASFQVLGWSKGWAHVRLADGTTGWISGTVLPGSSSSSSATPTYHSYAYKHSKKRAHQSHTSSSLSAHTLTAGVRIHSSPGVNAPVIGSAAPGTQVTVLGHKKGWALVRLPNGQTGYVLGTYVH